VIFDRAIYLSSVLDN